ncbi:MAG: DUF6335 family protein [Cyanobacteria bacterium P01_A01_bin.135]
MNNQPTDSTPTNSSDSRSTDQTQSQTNIGVGENTAGADPQGISADQTPLSDVTPNSGQAGQIAAGKPTTGGDTFANQGQAKVAGEEAVGGTTPTPGQNVVGNLGESVGITYPERQPVAGAEIMEERDENRWELDPDSKESR